MCHTRGGTYSEASVSLFPTGFVAALGAFPLATSGPSRGRVVILKFGFLRGIPHPNLYPDGEGVLVVVLWWLAALVAFTSGSLFFSRWFEGRVMPWWRGYAA